MLALAIPYYTKPFHLYVKHCTTVNPADMIPPECEGKPHDCVAETSAFTRLRPDLVSSLISDADINYFVDGSCFRDQAVIHAGYAGVKKQLFCACNLTALTTACHDSA